MLLTTDEIILEILQTAKQDGNELLQHFHIRNPSKKIAEESNSIFVATVSSEQNLNGYEFESFRELVEILIVTKQNDYKKAITIIKTVSKLICKLLIENQHKFPNKPVIRSINPEFNKDYILTRGHIMVQCNTNPIDFDISDEEYNICEVILNEIEEV